MVSTITMVAQQKKNAVRRFMICAELHKMQQWCTNNSECNIPKQNTWIL